MKKRIRIFTVVCMMLSCAQLGAQNVIIGTPEKIPGCDGPMPLQKIYYETGNKVLLDRQQKKQQQTDGVAMATGGFLAWPLRMTADYEGINGVYSYFFVSNYVDQYYGEFYDEGDRQDWRCYEGESARNYDDHNGADIVPYPFPWQIMDDESIDVIAAADGVVMDIIDINSFDRNCDTPHVFIVNDTLLNHGYGGNYIRLQHFDADLTQTIYAHLKHGTLADIHPGDTVRQGDYLGKIGSAGNSSGPHLHFEVHQYSAYLGGWHLVEPWDDPGTLGVSDCNLWLDNSLWIDQLPYFNKQLIRITTHDASPVFKSCAAYESGSNEDVNIANHFNAVSMKIRIAIRDPEAGDHIDIDIYTSTGTLKTSIDYDIPSSKQIENYEWTQSLLFWASDTYRIRVTYDGKKYDHYFTVGCSGDKIYSGAQSGHKGYISGGAINSTSTISGTSANNVLYQAETYVKLNEGFLATANCIFRAQIDDCTIGGMKEDPEFVQDDQKLLVYPNPSMGRFTIAYQQQDAFNGKINICDAMGRLVYHSELENGNNMVSRDIDLSTMPKGIYFVELLHDTTRENASIVIQ